MGRVPVLTFSYPRKGRALHSRQREAPMLRFSLFALAIFTPLFLTACKTDNIALDTTPPTTQEETNKAPKKPTVIEPGWANGDTYRVKSMGTAPPQNESTRANAFYAAMELAKVKLEQELIMMLPEETDAAKKNIALIAAHPTAVQTNYSGEVYCEVIAEVSFPSLRALIEEGGIADVTIDKAK